MPEQFLTFIVPAPDGCNLRCPFCIVRQRNETGGVSLRPDEFAQFITEARERETVYALAIQGYEPLLPESMAHTQEILETGVKFGIPATFVTNGVYLGDALDRLITLRPNSIAVSLDSDIAAVHDRIRGVPGAWDTIVEGLRQAVDRLMADTEIVITSVLFPLKVENLLGMPRLLADIGVNGWIVNPIAQISERRGVRAFERDVEILRGCRRLQGEAEKCGIRFTCDDEFGHINQARAAEIYPELGEVRVHRIRDDIELFRLTPSGQCSVGRDVLAPVTPDVPRWIPNAVHAADFLASLPRPPRVVHDGRGDIRRGQSPSVSKGEMSNGRAA